jgi:hypothetical protein
VEILKLTARLRFASDKRNATFESIYDMAENKQELLDTAIQIINSYRSNKKQVWYYEVALMIEANMNLGKH